MFLESETRGVFLESKTKEQGKRKKQRPCSGRIVSESVFSECRIVWSPTAS